MSDGQAIYSEWNDVSHNIKKAAHFKGQPFIKNL